MPILASQKKMKWHVKKNNTFKYNILNCYPFCQEVIIVVYKQKRRRKKASPVGQPKVKQV